MQTQSTNTSDPHPGWLSRLVSLFDDRERMHREIGVLLAKNQESSARIAEMESENERIKKIAMEQCARAVKAEEEAESFRKLVTNEAEARKLVGAVSTLKAFLG